MEASMTHSIFILVLAVVIAFIGGMLVGTDWRKYGGK